MTDSTYVSANGADNLIYIDFKVYIAGVLLPHTAIYITSAFSNIPVATITLPPYKELFGLGRQDRVPVHIFAKNKFIKDNKENYEGKTVKEGDPKYLVGEYLLIFEGETTGYGYLSDAGGRDFVINAQSHLGFLKDVKLNFILSSEDYYSTFLNGACLESLKINQLTNFIFPLSLFLDGFATKRDTPSSHSIRYPTALIENIFDLLVDNTLFVKYKNQDENSLANFWQKYLTKKINLRKRVKKVPFIDDDGFPLLRMVQQDQLINQFNKFLQEGLPQNGGTLWDIIYAVFSRMEYEINIPPAPTYDPTNKVLNSVIAKPMMYDAVPPVCNIIFRNQIKTIRVDETTYDVPTRIRIKDFNKNLISYGREGDTADLLWRLTYYPSTFYNTPTPAGANTNFDLFASEMLDTEKYTGPYLYDAEAPPWSTYVRTGQFDGTTAKDQDKQYRMTLMKSMLLLKIYEHRQITVTIDYNPFIVAGAPCVIFDVIPNGINTEGLVFVGYVLSVYHSITRSSLRTSVTLGYSRLIQEEFNEETKLYNVYKPFSKDVTQNTSKMDDIYMSMFGCKSMTVDTDDQLKQYKSFYDLYYLDATQDNPRDSLVFQERRLCTMDEYCSYMNLTPVTEKNSENEDVITRIVDTHEEGTEGYLDRYMSDRKSSELIPNLLKVQAKCFKNNIYDKK